MRDRQKHAEAGTGKERKRQKNMQIKRQTSTRIEQKKVKAEYNVEQEECK